MHPSHFCASRRNRAAAATKRADNLTQAILAKAFRGERVPTKAELARREGRTYEPAFELLARIRSARENSTTSVTFPKRRSTTSNNHRAISAAQAAQEGAEETTKVNGRGTKNDA